MFAKLQMELKTENNAFMPYQKAVILQGILMEQIGSEYASLLHGSSFHPYSQWVINQEGKNIWNICTTNKEAYQKIMIPMQNSQFSGFFIEHDNCKVDIRQRQLFQIDKNEFMERYYFEDSDRYMKIIFRTPTAFKSQGEYVYIPRLKLIYQSLMNKYDAAVADETVKSEEVLEQLAEYSKIVSYNLHSCSYSVHGVRIPSFMGELGIKINGPQAMVNFINLLFRFGEYSGIGIKTAMGMGNINIIERVRR